MKAKKEDIKADLTKALGVNAGDVKIVSITEVDARRRRSLLATKKIVIVYEVKVKNDSAAKALVTEMESDAYKAKVKAGVASSLNVDVSTITVTAEKPTESSTDSSTTTKAGTVSSAISTYPSMLASAFVLSVGLVL